MQRWLILLLGLALCGDAGAGVYRWTDENGAVQFGDRPPVAESAQEVEIQPNVYASPASVNPEGDPASPPTTASQSANQPKVTLYSATWCGICKQAKRYFRQNDIAYTEYDVEHSNKGRTDYKRLGMTGVPVILVGKQRLDGFSATSFEALYER